MYFIIFAGNFVAIVKSEYDVKINIRNIKCTVCENMSNILEQRKNGNQKHMKLHGAFRKVANETKSRKKWNYKCLLCEI